MTIESRIGETPLWRLPPGFERLREDNPFEQARIIEMQRLHEENAKLAWQVLRLRSTVLDRERMIWIAIAMWLVLLAAALATR